MPQHPETDLKRTPGRVESAEMELFPLVMGADHRWMLGIGDPTFVGWLTVAAYFTTAWLCLRAARRARGLGDPYAMPDPKIGWVWLGLVVLCAALGVNKQLDLQSLVTQIGKDMARSQGWYEGRRIVQTIFVVTIGVAAAVAGGIGLYWLRDRLAQIWPAIVGAVLMTGFVVIRAASFHHVDWLLYRATGAIELNWIFELGALACISWAAVRKVPAPDTPHPHRIRRDSARGAVPSRG